MAIKHNTDIKRIVFNEFFTAKQPSNTVEALSIPQVIIDCAFLIFSNKSLCNFDFKQISECYRKKQKVLR